MPIKKESLAAVFLSRPENNAEVKVMPDLETPGNNARDCERPNKHISVKLISENILFLLPITSEIASNKAIKIETIEIENRLLKFESEKFGQYSLISKPKINIGTFAKKI